MRRLFSIMLIIACCCSTVLSQASGAFAKTAPPTDLTAPPTSKPIGEGVEKQAVDSIAGSTTLGFDLTTYQSFFQNGWGTLLCIAPWENLDDKQCTTLALVSSPTDPGFYYLQYSMTLNNTGNGSYSYRGKAHGMWLGYPCNGGSIKSFVYPQLPTPPATNIHHIEDVDPIPTLPAKTTPDGKLIPGWPFHLADC